MKYYNFEVKEMKKKDLKRLLLIYPRRSRTAFGYYTGFKKKYEKEVKKMEYFETKVVKVKKKDLTLPYCPICSIPINKCAYYKKIQKKKAERAYKEGKWSGKNWVNGENLDKIKFPCFCSFTFPKGHKHIGVINKIGGIDDQYILTDIDKQYHQTGCLLWMQHKLKDLIKYFDIHILKGKIIIYEEE